MGSTGIQHSARPSVVSAEAYCSASKNGGGSSRRSVMACVTGWAGGTGSEATALKHASQCSLQPFQKLWRQSDGHLTQTLK